MAATVTPAEVADGYAEWIERTGFSPGTKQVYVTKVRNFTDWLAEQDGRYADAFSDEWVRDYAARDYRRHMLVDLGRKPATVQLSMSAVTSFFRWLGMDAPRGVNVDVPRSAPKALTTEQTREVLRAAERRGPRDLAIASLIFLAGPRVAEVAALNVDDVFLSERMGQAQIRYGKGGKPRTIPLTSQVRGHLRAWMVDRKKWAGADGPALFLSHRGGRLSIRSTQDAISQCGEGAGIKLSPHILRHTFGRRFVEAGGHIEALRELMGHSDVRTTAGYTRASREYLEDAVARLDVDL
jgi:site-specific recombinase XerD